MGWNLHLSLVRDRTTADMAELGASLGMFALSGEPVTAEEATGLPTPAVAQAGQDVLLIDGPMVATQFNVVLAARLGAEVVTGIFSSAADSYLWSVLRPDGGHRSLAVSGGVVTGEEGAATPEEQGLGVLDEDWLFTLLERRTGLGEDWLDLPAYPLVGVAARG